MDAGPRSGQRFGAYRLLDELGRGGMGVVYRAEHEHLGRTVALKLLTPDLAESAGFRERFQREARLAASLDHPNVVPVYDAGEVDGTLYLAMRFVEGTDLAAVLKQEGRLDPARTIAVLDGVAAALDAAHARGLVHRDVKPANVMIEDSRCFLTDFGLTKRLSGNTALTQAGQFLGTVDYVAPEQIEGRALDGRADVYALGCLLHQCLTGSPPFPRSAQIAVIYAQLKEPPPRPTELRPELPNEIDDVVARAMAKLPEQRYATAGELAAAASEALAGTTVGVAPAAPPPRTHAQPVAPPPPAIATGGPPDTRHVYRRRPRRRAPVASVAVVAALALAAAAAVAVLSGGEDSAGEGSSRTASASGSGSQPRVVGSPIPVGERPFGVTVAGGSLWVANEGSDTVTRVSPDGERRSQIAVGDGPFGAASAAGTVWIANSRDGTLDRIDASTARPLPKLSVGDSPYFVAVNDRRAYATNGGGDSVSEFYVPSGNPRRAPFATGSKPRGLAIAGGVIWVANSADGTVSRIEHGVTTDRISVGRNPTGVTAGGGAIWVANKDSDSVSRIRVAEEPGEAETFPVGDAPFGIAFGEGAVWVANSGDDTVTRIDPERGEVVGDPIDVPGQPVGVAVGEGSVWVTANDEEKLFRIAP